MLEFIHHIIETYDRYFENVVRLITDVRCLLHLMLSCQLIYIHANLSFLSPFFTGPVFTISLKVRTGCILPTLVHVACVF